MQTMDLGDALHKKAGLVLKYVALRKEELADILAMINKEDGASEKRDSLIIQINSIAEQLR